MRVLVGCEFSGVVRDAFIAAGHDAWSCDTVVTGHRKHICGRLEKVINDQWDMIICHPPCTYLSNVGSSALYSKNRKNLGKVIERRTNLHYAIEFFSMCYNANCSRVCIENPIPTKEAVERIGVKYLQIIQPYQFGHPYSKATCLWLRGLPLLKPTKIVKPLLPVVTGHTRKAMRLKKIGNLDRGRLKSIFHTGIAAAMASQWGILEY